MTRRWHAIYEVEPERPSIVAVRIEPTQQEAKAAWLVEMGEDMDRGSYVDVAQDLGSADVLTSRMARALKPDRALREALAAFADKRYRPGIEMLDAHWAALADRAARQDRRTSEGRRVRLAGIAARYVVALQAGDHTPVATVASMLGLRAPQVRDLLHKARWQGLLAPESAPRGRAVGTLTDVAIALLEQQEDLG